jgi:hypothetical protein
MARWHPSKTRVAAIVPMLAALHAGAASAQIAPGDEFAVDQPAQGVRDHYPDVAVGANGAIVFAWADTLDTGQIAARRYDAAAIPLGPAFRVDSGVFDAGSDISGPGVAVDADGGFVVAWHAITPHQIHGRRYEGSGVAVGDEFLADGALTGLALLPQPRVAPIFSDEFVVVWNAATSDSLSPIVVGRRIDPDGVPIGTGFQANGAAACENSAPAVAAEADGDYVVAWCEAAGAEQALYARRFRAASGAGAPFELAPSGAEGLNPVAISADAAGDVVAVWGSGGTVMARVFDATNTALGPAFAVGAGDAALHPAVAFDHAGGAFTVAWENTVAADEDVDVVGRRFDAGGQPLGAEFRVNATTAGLQFAPRVAATDEGFVVTWASETDIVAEPTIGIRARRYLVGDAADPIFRGGFE